ncbi:similar to An12g10600 [Aspergillus tubingensis]|uniref:Similar to An12g10600 n=1 Tax=Aspergillus niger TaxID=5061 RepID=A0A124BZ30_ASPNG|nr:similar to An12g10600 [Aspergillus tubingensis]GAQ47421.1 similar to An12g10600 [Aspergillus niger]GFN11437.1 similar to An12g10600 [Aspergillus tubingensis]
MSTNAPISTNLPSHDADETMREAVDRFRTRMAAANRQFIQDRIDEIDARGLATEKEKIRMIQRWRHFGDLDQDEPASENNPDARHISNRFRQTRELAAVPALLAEDTHPLFALDGIHPPLLCTPEARQIFLDTLQEVFQRQAEEWAAAEGEDIPSEPIPRCEELGRLLAYAHEVEDPDFRHSGIAPLEAGLSVQTRYGTLPCLDTQEERDHYHARIRQECAWLQERLEGEYTDLINKVQIPASPDVDLDVRAGVVMGTGYVGEYPKWYSAYLYCRKSPDEDMEGIHYQDEGVQDAPNIREWGWRVVFMEEEGIMQPQVLYGRKPRFDSIPEFLDWYASWPDYLDARGLLSLRRHLKGCEIDCESDCEMHEP